MALHQLLVIEIQHAAEDFSVVLPKKGRGSVYSGWRGGELEGGILELAASHNRMVQLRQVLSHPQLRVMLYPVFGTLHGHGPDPRGLARLHQLILLQRDRPRFKLPIDLLLILKAPLQTAILRVSCPGWTSHQV